MSYFKNDSVQVAEYEYDFEVDGGTVGVKVLSAKDGKANLPVGAIRIGFAVVIQTAFTSGGLATLTLGHTTSAVAYLGSTAVADLGAGLEASSSTAALVAANGDNVIATIGTAAMTAGKLKVLVYFVNPNS